MVNLTDPLVKEPLETHPDFSLYKYRGLLRWGKCLVQAQIIGAKCHFFIILCPNNSLQLILNHSSPYTFR